jgi:hypothetical protein
MAVPEAVEFLTQLVQAAESGKTGCEASLEHWLGQVNPQFVFEECDIHHEVVYLRIEPGATEFLLAGTVGLQREQ